MNRWFHLIGYALLIFSSQILWVTFSPITTDTAALMNTSVGNVGTLAALFPIVYIVVAFPAGRWLDSHFKAALGFGALTVGMGALARFALPYSYPWQLSVQLILAIGQPFIINAISAYASRYFPEKSRSIAISLSSVSLFLGVIFALALSPIIFHKGGLVQLFSVFAIPSVISMAWVWFTLVKKESDSSAKQVKTSAPLKELFKDKLLWILSGLLAIGLGVFDALSTWIEPIFAQYGIPGTTSGPLLALMLSAGIIGSAVLPAWIARRGARRTLIITALFITAAGLTAISAWQWLPWMMFWLIASGFFLLAGLPVIMDWIEKHFDVDKQGTAVGFVMLTSHVGGVLTIYIVSIFLTPASLALAILAALNLAGLFLARLLPKKEEAFKMSG